MANFAKDTVTNRSSTRRVLVFGGARAWRLALHRILPALSRAATTLEENLRLRPATPVNGLRQPRGIYHPLETPPRKGKASLEAILKPPFDLSKGLILNDLKTVLKPALIDWTSARAFTGRCNRPRKKSSSCKTL